MRNSTLCTCRSVTKAREPPCWHAGYPPGGGGGGGGGAGGGGGRGPACGAPPPPPPRPPPPAGGGGGGGGGGRACRGDQAREFADAATRLHADLERVQRVDGALRRRARDRARQDVARRLCVHLARALAGAISESHAYKCPGAAAGGPYSHAHGLRGSPATPTETLAGGRRGRAAEGGGEGRPPWAWAAARRSCQSPWA